MIEEIIIAGSGGQGVLTLGKYLAESSAKEGKHVAWMPAYGAEKRGGPSFCSLIVSDGEIFSPMVETPGTLIAFDQRALETYIGKASGSTLVIENKSMILNDVSKNTSKINVPAVEIAVKLGAARSMNIVLAGVLLAAKNIFSRGTAESVLKEMLGGKGGKFAEKNLAAFNEGFNFAKERLTEGR
jgi:2-oxoglutarate ferredoxin oxidoreductase subunit gamma